MTTKFKNISDFYTNPPGERADIRDGSLKLMVRRINLKEGQTASQFALIQRFPSGLIDFIGARVEGLPTGATANIIATNYKDVSTKGLKETSGYKDFTAATVHNVLFKTIPNGGDTFQLRSPDADAYNGGAVDPDGKFDLALKLSATVAAGTEDNIVKVTIAYLAGPN